MLCLAIWVYLTLARGWFWRVCEFEDNSKTWELQGKAPSVVALVPARNEAATIGATVAALARQDYDGKFWVLVVDDHSADGTALIAAQAAREANAEGTVRVFEATELAEGWTGKLWALNEGVRNAGEPEYYWLTDADVVHAPGTLRKLVGRAERDELELASLMVLLRAKTVPERLLIPAFLFFFLKLYPPRWTEDPRARTAGAAGGCALLRRAALEGIGGFAAIRGEVIDDCALAAAVKRSGGGIWMGLTRDSASLRAYGSFAEIRDLIARTAFTQLGYSVWLLLGTVVGMALTYLVPVALLFAAGWEPRMLGLGTWCLMTGLYWPTVRFYRLPGWWAMLLPAAAAFYLYATSLSAARFWVGRGGYWKGRAQAQRRS